MNRMYSFTPIVDEDETNSNIIISAHHKGQLSTRNILINGKVFGYLYEDNLNPQEIVIPIKSKYLLYEMDSLPSCCNVQQYASNAKDQLKEIEIQIYYHSKPRENRKEFSRSGISNQFKTVFMDKYVNDNQTIPFYYKNFQLEGTIKIRDQGKNFGFIDHSTKVHLTPLPHQQFVLVSFDQDPPTQIAQQSNTGCLFEEQPSMKQKLQKIRVGGLSQQIREIYRRIFLSRKFSGQDFEKLGLKHVKGMILHGPPGTGKTLLARQISNILDIRPTIVNGPQILDKYVGEGERKLRQIFEPAIEEYKKKGGQSSLHLIIFDEIDSLSKKRGSSSTAGDTLVNQLLTLIDGVQSPNNILIIGMTNRIDLIDEALLRPGRLQMHVQIFLPDQQGRRQIFDIHLEKLKKMNCLADDVKSQQLARVAKNYTGAQIQSIVKSSLSFALEENQSIETMKQIDLSKVRIFRKHFLLAIADVNPQFGQDGRFMNKILPTKQISFTRFKPGVQKSIQSWVSKCLKMKQGKLTLLIKGKPRTGKTVLAAQLSKMLGLSFTKWISYDRIYSLCDQMKVQQLVKILQDSKRCRESCIILDDLFRLIEYVPLGNKYNNSIFQVIKNIIESFSQKGKRKVIIATSDSLKIIEDFGLSKLFLHTLQLSPMTRQQASLILSETNINIEDIMIDQSKEEQGMYPIGQISDIIHQSKRESQ